jgi:hypothetical protein
VWRSGLRHYIAVLAVPPETLVSIPGSVAAGHSREVHGATHNWPSVVRVKEGLAGRDIFVSLCTSNSCGGPGAVHTDQVARCTVFSPNPLVWLASRLDVRCVKKLGWVVFRRTHGSRPLSLPSPYGKCSD